MWCQAVHSLGPTPALDSDSIRLQPDDILDYLTLGWGSRLCPATALSSESTEEGILFGTRRMLAVGPSCADQRRVTAILSR